VQCDYRLLNSAAFSISFRNVDGFDISLRITRPPRVVCIKLLVVFVYCVVRVASTRPKTYETSSFKWAGLETWITSLLGQCVGIAWQ
jgi:hypothetical protein